MAHIKAEANEKGISDISTEGEGFELCALLGAICNSLSGSGIPPKMIRKAVQMGIDGVGLTVLGDEEL